MKTELLKIKTWSSEVNGRFFEELKDYFDEEKCAITEETAKELMSRGDSANVSCAETILVYATQHYFNVDDTHFKAIVYYRLGLLYEKCRNDYVKAYTAYEKFALNNTRFDGTHSILLRMLLLRDDCTYSDELEKELRFSYAETDLGLREDRLYENLAAYIVADHENDAETAEKHKKRLKAIVNADKLPVLDLFLKKDSIRDILQVPEKIIDYINAL